MTDEDDSELPAALLTKAQRAYLRGERDYSPSTESDVRQRIRERLAASMDDLSLLARELDFADLQRVYLGAPVDGTADSDVVEGEYRDARPEGLAEMLYAAHLPVAHLAGEDVNPFADEPHGHVVRDLATVIKTGIRNVLAARQGVTLRGVTVEISVDRDLPTEEGEEIDLADMDPESLLRLFKSGEISDDELSEAVRELRKHDEDFGIPGDQV